MAVMKMVFENGNMEGRKIEFYKEAPDTLTVSVRYRGNFVYYDRLDRDQLRNLVQYLSVELGRMPE